MSFVINYAKNYSITIKDSKGNAINGKKVTFKLNGKNIGSAYTNSKGIASFKITTKILKSAKIGTKKLTITLEEDNNFNTAIKTVNIKINKEKTKLIAKNKKFKDKVKIKKYTVKLKNSKKKGVKKVKVTLKVKRKIYTAKTNSKGRVTFKIKNLNKKGKFKVIIKFKGDKYYKATSKKVKITLK